MLRLIKLKGTDTLLKFFNKMSVLPEICVPSYDHKWTSLGELLTSGNSVSADMTFTIKLPTDHTYLIQTAIQILQQGVYNNLYIND